MVVKGRPYINPEGYLFLDQKRKPDLFKRIRKQIDKFKLSNEELGLEIAKI
jgi:transposase